MPIPFVNEQAGQDATGANTAENPPHQADHAFVEAEAVYHTANHWTDCPCRAAHALAACFPLSLWMWIPRAADSGVPEWMAKSSARHFGIWYGADGIV